MEIIPTLKQYGLDDREVAVYLALLELGPSVVQRIALRSKIKRTTIYLVAEALKSKGLISEFRDRRGIHYVAEPPQSIIESLMVRERRIREILPQLMALSNKGMIKPQMTFYEGAEGIRGVCDDSIRQANTEVLFIGSFTDMYKVISPEYDAEYYIPTRLKKNIKIRMVVFKDIYTQKLAIFDGQELRETRFLPNKFNFAASQFIYTNKIAYISSEKELVGAIIESADIALLEKQKFEMLWQWLS